MLEKFRVCPSSTRSTKIALAYRPHDCSLKELPFVKHARKGWNSMRVFFCQSVFALIATILVGQQPPADIPVDEGARNSVIDRLVSKVESGYIVPEGAQVAVRNLRSAQASGLYKNLDAARTFAEKLTSDLRAATHDKHIAVFFDPEASTSTQSAGPQTKPHEHFNFGFYKIERLEQIGR